MIHLPTSASDVSINRVDVSFYPTRLPVLVCSSSLLCEVFVASTPSDDTSDGFRLKIVLVSTIPWDGDAARD
jgi:hypothetical protein